MSVSVFFSNKNIQIVVGKCNGRSIHVDRLIEAPMPDNAILNGVVIEGGDDAISAKLKEIWNANNLKGAAELIINSPQFMANRMTIPVLGSIAKSTAYIDKQTASEEFGRFSDPLKGWYLLGKGNDKNAQVVVTEIAERTAIETYIKIFSKAGITLNSVHDGVSLATEMLGTCIGSTTSIYMIRDAQNLVTILYEKGKYYYNSTRRIFQEPGTPEFTSEIKSTISGIRQFANSQRITSAITDVYFAGISNDDVGQLYRALKESDPDITVHATAAPSHIRFGKFDDKLSSFIYPVAGLCIPSTGFGVLKAIRNNSEDYARRKDLITKSIPLLILSAVLLIVVIFLGLVSVRQNIRLRELEKYNSDPDVYEAVSEYDALVTEAGLIGEKQGGANLLEDTLATYPVPDISVNNAILEAAKAEKVNVEFNAYDSSSGIFAITASSGDVENINKFIARLLGMDIFENVDYTGYEWNEGDLTWSIKVTTTLVAGDAREE